MTRSRLFLTSSRGFSSGCARSAALALSSVANSAILRVNASLPVARSIAFLKRAVAISSIVRVILRMLRTALRRFTRTFVLAIAALLARFCETRLNEPTSRGLELGLERLDGGVQFRLDGRRQFALLLQLGDHLVALLVHE